MEVDRPSLETNWCYVDDTLVTVNWRISKRWRAYPLGVSLWWSNALRRMALNKTEALLFHGSRRGPPSSVSIKVNSVLVTVCAQKKCLSLILDIRSEMLFDEHFRHLASRQLIWWRKHSLKCIDARLNSGQRMALTLRSKRNARGMKPPVEPGWLLDHMLDLPPWRLSSWSSFRTRLLREIPALGCQEGIEFHLPPLRLKSRTRPSTL